MNRITTAGILAVLVFAAAGSAEAASCQTKLLKGIWVGHATSEVDLYCLIDVDGEGAISQSSCFNPQTLKPTATLSGKLSVTSDCKVEGTFKFKSGKVTDPALFKGKLVPGKEVMNGDFVIFDESEDYKFARQLD